MKIMKYVLMILFVIMLAVTLTACDEAADVVDDVQDEVAKVEDAVVDPNAGINLHGAGESITDPDVALAFLKEGNARFVSNKTISRDEFSGDAAILAEAQKPFASIVTCADSRVAPELYFDQKMGDIFILRNAGNIADGTVLGSLEFSVAALEVPLIVVVGHSACGAVKGTMSGATDFPAHLQGVLDFIRPGIAQYTDVDTELDDATIANVNAQVEKILADPVVKDAGIKVIGAIYDIGSGKVTWL
jgi:carbonic anhydrase